MSDALFRKLESLNQNFHILKDAHGGYAVILEKGSRLLHLVPANHTESAVWNNFNALEDGTWNVGGERTWISPEINFFSNASGNYDIPAQLDPGSYRITPSDKIGTVRTEQTCLLNHWPDHSTVTINLTKEYSLISNPFQMNSGHVYKNLANTPFIGLQCETRMLLLPVTDHMLNALPEFNLWTILQVPPDGTVLVPTWGESEPLVMLQDQEVPQITRQSHYSSFQFRGNRSFKLSYNSLQSTGRFGYFRKLNKDVSSLIVRQFQVIPSAMYPDYPECQPDYIGSCMQFFYDGGKMGGFGELEYHAPSLKGKEFSVQSDISQIFYFVGSDVQIKQIAFHMLGIHNIDSIAL